MLINKGLASGDIVCLKMINGDEIIARLDNETTENVTVTKPLALTMSSSGGLGMIPWIFLNAKDSITISKNHVFVLTACKADAAKQYMENTTGIAMG